MSGTNVHMVVREAEAPVEAVPTGVAPYWLLALSAKSAVALQQRLRDLRVVLRSREWDAAALQSLVYTLLCGRQHFAHRCVIVAQDHGHALHLLDEAVRGTRGNGICAGVVPHEFVGQKALERYGEELLARLREGKETDALPALAELHCQGYALPWAILFSDSPPPRIALPTYPFARDRYWVDGSAAFVRLPGVSTHRHPLLHENTSDVDAQRFSSRFTGDEFLLRDHVVLGERVLPGMAYLEMARAAVNEGGGAPPAPDSRLVLRHVVWSRPLIVRDQAVDLHISLFRQGQDEIGYEIYSSPAPDDDAADRGRIVHSQGAAAWTQYAPAPRIDVEQLESRCEVRLSAAECYERLQTSGLDYGASFRALESASVGTDDAGADCVVARLNLPEAARPESDRFVLHPALLDSALHAVVGLWRAGSGGDRPLVPYSLEQVRIYDGTRTACFAVLRRTTTTAQLPMLQVEFCDADGNVCVVLENLSARPARNEAAPLSRTVHFGREWRDSPLGVAESVERREERHVLVLQPDDGDAGLHDALAAGLGAVDGLRWERIDAPGTIAERYARYGWHLIGRVQEILKAGGDSPVLLQLVIEQTPHGELLNGLGALLQTARLENPRLRGQVVGLDGERDVEAWLQRLHQDAGDDAVLVRYRDGVRQLECGFELAPPPGSPPWKADGVYLVTGGLGSLGQLFASEILRRAPGARLVLAGRSAPNQAQRQQLSAWADDAGFDVEYRQADLSRREEVDALIAHIDQRHGRLDGVIHSAGVIRDSFLLNKTHDDYAAVIGAKVLAVAHLDAAIGARPLDLFVLFASTSGVYGNPGQADYAAANAFLDGYARHRRARVERGECHGRTLSVAWPLWADGSMRMPDAARLRLRERGLVELSAADGVAALYAALATGRTRVHLHRMTDAVERRPAAPPPVSAPVAVAPVAVAPAAIAALPADAGDRFGQQVLSYLKQALSGTLKLPVENIEADAPFERYGLDSILALELTNALERIFGSLSKTLFFEYQTLAALSRYFQTAHRDRLLQLVDGAQRQTQPRTAGVAPAVAASVTAPTRREWPSRERPAVAAEPSRSDTAARELVAIVGVAGRYPGADTLDAFWDNLKAGRDAITEVPAERWNHDAYFEPQKGTVGKTYGKWGGFIAGVADFDPLFFNIPPVEAYGLDPQERLFLQCAYETLEDAGYTRESLGRQTRRGREGNVGVFVGVMYEEYQLYGAQAQTVGHGISLSGSPASIANRVSYFCNFHGPSLAVDTMCSSSLTAIHLACESLLRGQCEAALAGGVNVSVHPNKYLMLAQGRFLSSDGRCRSFGEGGDGYVPGEGVGAVLLKPLSNAVADEDRIYAVIRGSSINHGGKTNGFAVPNPVAQADLIAQALQDSNVDARTISYLEAHGTGTSLGDPIEIRGLVSAFQAQTSDKGFCAIGSVKSNIGHCESAAGIAALTKVLLQMKHGMLVPSLHSETINPFIDFADTPFVVQRELSEWPRAVGAALREQPRRGGISSFGAGGSNAHLVIEEYPQATARRATAARSSRLVLLSAKSEEALQRQVRQLLAFAESAGEDDLADIAYTLQVGREAMEFRLALTVDSVGELCERLRACTAGETEVPGCGRGEVKRNKELLAAFAGDDDLQRAVASWLARGKLEKLLEFWVKGLRIDWNGLYANEAPPRRIALPTYPFERERYWIGLRELGLEPAVADKVEVAVRESVLSKGWREAPLAGPVATVGSVLIVADAGTRTLAQALALRVARSRIVRSDEDEWRGTVDWSEWEALVDVTGCGEASIEALAWVEIVQAWVLARAPHGGRALCVTQDDGAALRAGLYGMLQSEYGRIRSRHVDVDNVDGEAWIAQVVQELGAPDDAVEVTYRNDRRYRAQLEEGILAASAAELDWAPEGVLWITGGTRGLGLACARHFVRRHGVKRLVLTGRETLPERAQWQARAVQADATGQKLRALLALQADGVTVEVTSVDLCDEAALEQEMRRLQSLGPIHGVLHCAGLADAQTPAFVRKTVAGIAAVLAPKVVGLETLLRCLRGSSSLRFCVLFSSISALVPDLASGQADYAMANAYMDHVARREQAGDLPVVSVQWGSWNESGMGEVKSRVYRELGLLSHSDEQGMHWLDRIVATQHRGVLAPLLVDGSRFEAQRLLRRRDPPAVRAPAEAAAAASALSAPLSAPSGEGLLSQVEGWLHALFAHQLQIPREKVDLQTPLPDYGVDSVLLMQVLVPIGAQVNDTLDPSILYEHQTITAFARWLISKYETALRANLSAGEVAGEAAPSAPVDVGPVNVGPVKVAPVTVLPTRAPALPPPVADEALAVVGLSCRFAGANDVSAYWDLLAQGRSAIAPVPSSRWGATSGDDWAALLDDVNHFDPEHFRLLLADARAMDRQALLVLEESLKAWHHAGYAAAELKGTRCGVYLGARGQFNADATSLRESVNPILAMGQNYLASNISQFFDLRGPSLVVDTACSSALVALSIAAQGLRSGEIDAALVGGVSLLNGPGALRLFEQRGILKRGAFHIFDRRAQGAILGEGVGMVVLKRHAQAVADGDRIYALVRAVAVNNDGRTAGPTAPNVHAQKDVMQQALDRSGWRAQDISHIDVNGSGSEITDLLELRAVEAVYRPDRVQPCELGSMKPNIGHPLCAEGIASLIKVVLMLHHGQRVPFLSAQEPMAHYDLDASPFRFTRQLRPWGDAPRVAAINSFADGGTNAHVIVEGAVAHADAWRQPIPAPVLKRVWLPAQSSPAEREDANGLDRNVEAGRRPPLVASRRSASRRAERPNGEAFTPAVIANEIQLTSVPQEPGFWERYA
ncbi:SDR family NAD(P)-dependent oxidoreductase [Tahibacter sp.]|uniref:SDR family NAD(P)-dependent oxidoreductase n=1 Tax=Tahibacter sp. TaxID=2056211 RepID=UPI0028C4270E|nr:SDR family NAD(P)-dependent oxidoreductase [Tahibacter sp.]